jgi:hypothetical protein
VTLELPRLPPTQPEWGAFQIWWQQVVEAIETQEGRQDDAIAAIAAAQAAATAANTAAATANAAAADITAQASLSDSYVTGLTISATDAGSNATITISAHSRVYPQPDGSNVTVSVNSGSLTGRAYSTDYWIYYDDPTRAGGAVTYQSATSQASAAQTGDRHSVGAVTTPAAAGAPKTGRTVQPPGGVEP